MKKILVLALLALALPALPGAAGDLPTAALPGDLAQPPPADLSQQVPPDLAPAVGVPAPRPMNACNDICIADFKICRDSCRSIACYNQCRSALETCQAGCYP